MMGFNQEYYANKARMRKNLEDKKAA